MIIARTKRVIAVFVTVLLLVSSFAMNAVSVWADDTFTAAYTVKYDQTGARSMLDYINKFRLGNDVDGQPASYLNSDNTTSTDLTGKLSALTYDYSLERTAMQRAAELATSYSHTRPDGSQCFTAWDSSIFWYSMGENIAAGYGSYTTAYSVFKGWREDDKDYSGQGHRRNMLNQSYNRIGIGHVVYNGVHYWAQAFGKGDGDDTGTTAVDSEQTVSVNVTGSSVASASLTADPVLYSIKEGETAALPAVTMTFRTNDTWPEGSYFTQTVTTPVSVSWTSGNTDIAVVQDGLIKAVTEGSTTLSAALYGAAVSVDVTVEKSQEPVHVHNLTKIEAKPAVCETDGNIEYYVCSGGDDPCGKYFADAEGKTEINLEDTVIPATGHNWGDWIVTKEATETEEGIETRTCGNDSSHTETRTIPKKAHVHKVTEVEAVKATCTSDGHTAYWVCDCGKIFSDAEACNEIAIEDTVIPATGHTPEVIPSVSATCTESGLTEGSRCSVCGEIFKKQEVIPATGHDWGEWTVTKEATETETGIETRVCKNDSSHTETRIIPVKDHTHQLVKVEANPAACEESGNIEYYVCSGGDNPCGRYFADAEGTKEINIEDTVIPATGHDWGDWEITKEPTATEAGIETRTCKSDPSHTETREIPAEGYKWAEPVYEWADDYGKVTATRVCENDPSRTETETVITSSEVAKEPTCDEEGIKMYTAVFENKVFETQTKTAAIPAEGHTLVKVPAKAATLKAEGNIEHYRCEECGKLFADENGETELTSADVTIAKLISIKKATITNIKSKTYTGRKQTQSPKVVLNGTTLKKGTDYKLTYSNNVNAGKATVKITGIGMYGSSVSKSFTISKAANTLKVTTASKTYKYSTVKKAKKTFSIGAKNAKGTVTYILNAKAKNAGIKVTSKGKVTIPKNCKKGTYKITVKAKGNSNYKAGTKTVTIKIN